MYPTQYYLGRSPTGFFGFQGSTFPQRVGSRSKTHHVCRYSLTSTGLQRRSSSHSSSRLRRVRQIACPHPGPTISGIAALTDCATIRAVKRLATSPAGTARALVLLLSATCCRHSWWDRAANEWRVSDAATCPELPF